MSASLSVQSLRDPLGGLAALRPYGAERVRRLDLRQRSDGALPKARSAKGVRVGTDPMDAVACVGTDHAAALDSEYAASVRLHLRNHVASRQEWVVGAVRTMRRSLRRELDESGADAQVERGLVAAMTPLLQQICDERLWQQRESECVAAITQEHEDVLRPLLALRDTLGRASASDQSTSSAMAKKKTEAAIRNARMAAVQSAQSEQDQIRQEYSRKEQQLAARLKAAEEEKSVLLARAEAAERVLVKGESKDQARMEALSDETRASRLKFLALSERLRQMTRLRDQDAQLIATLRAQLDEREKRITVLEGNSRGAARAGVAGGSTALGSGSILPVRLRSQR